VAGYRVHEEVHARHLNEMSATAAGFSSIELRSGRFFGETWVSGKKIESEFEAHRVQKKFYEDFLASVGSEKTRCQRLIKVLIAKPPSH
jgi:hypothetical protein